MKVKLLAHTQLSEDFYDSFDEYNEFIEWDGNLIERWEAAHGQIIALTAIRNCYSHLHPSEIVKEEGYKYFGTMAKEGDGTEADRLVRQIFKSKHLSTLEHISYTFAIEGVSRALLAQLTRHRIGFSYSVKSQRYVRFGSNDKSGGFDYYTPDSIKEKGVEKLYEEFMEWAQQYYDALREAGVPAEDSRMTLPNAATTDIVMTCNLRALIDFYDKRKAGNGAQAEIAELAETLKNRVVKVDPWTKPFFQ